MAEVPPAVVGNPLDAGGVAAPEQQRMSPPAVEGPPGEEAAPEQQSMETRAVPGPKCKTEEEAQAWAAEWCRGYEAKVNAADADTYNEVEGLLKLLEVLAGLTKPPVRLLRGSWLLKRARALSKAKTDEQRRQLALPRRQILERDHPEAFLSADEVRALYKKLLVRWWFYPCGACEERLRQPCCLCMACFIECCCCFDCKSRYIASFRGCSSCGERREQMPSGEFTVLYDFDSLLHKNEAGERSDEEQAAFKAALGSMGARHGHRPTTTAATSRKPDGWLPAPPHHNRGRTAFEHPVSQMIKPRSPLSSRRAADLEIPRNYFFVADEQRTRSEAPLHPRAFASLLARRTFTNGADCEVVANLYADTLAGAFGSATGLQFDNSAWGDEDLKQLAEVLPLARAATILLLRTNHYGERGVDAAASALEADAAPRLQELLVDSCGGAAEARLPTACSARGIGLIAR